VAKPVAMQVYSILYEKKSPMQAVQELMKRAKTTEV
jgi:glycerol-3-phosphate dehydrogenase